MANTLKFGNGQWATKVGSTLAYNDEGGNFKPLPFNFTRSTGGTRVNKDGLIEMVTNNKPRIDFLNDSNGALLLEPSRTNLVTKSENIQDWTTASNATTEFGYEDPFKGNRAVKLTSSSTAQVYQVYQSTGALSTGSTYTFSMYAKKGTGHIFRLDFGIPDNGFVHIDLRDGSLLQESGSTYYDGYKVEPMSNGWYRISMVSTFNSSAYYRAGLYQEQGDCYVAFSQIEQGSYATSYIPTQGATATRVAEVCSQTPPSGIIGQTEGTIYAEAKINGIKNSNTIVTLHNGSFSEYLVIAGNSSGNINAYIFAGGVQQAGILSGTIYAVDSVVKCAMAYKQNDVAFYINGVLIGTDSSATMASTSNFDVGSISFGDYTLNGTVKQAQLYTTRLSNAELQALTSN
jgi:hypothetical protein